MGEQKEHFVLEIRMLGPFSARAGQIELTEIAPRAARMWRLLQTLVQWNGSPISTDELIAILWPESETDNPRSALQSLVYRLRSLLAARCGAGIEFIRYANESYSWNTDAPYFVDTEELSRLTREAERAEPSNPTRARALYESALQLFRGEFLAGNAFDAWVIPAAAYYKSRYTVIFCRLCELLQAQEDWTAMARVAETAISFDFYEEDFHYYFLLALFHLHRFAQLKAHYDYYCLILAHNFTAEPGAKLSLSIREWCQQRNVQEDAALPDIALALAEDDAEQGAYICDPDVFAELFRMRRRDLSRSKQALFLLSLDFSVRRPAADSALHELPALVRLVASFHLRRSDVMTQYGPERFLLLVSARDMADCETVVSRFAACFSEADGNHLYALRHSVLKIERAT